MLEFGSAEEKVQATWEVKLVALQCTIPNNENTVDDSEQEDEDESICQLEVDNSDDRELLRPLSWYMGYRGFPLE